MDDETIHKEIESFNSIEFPVHCIFSQFLTSLMWSKGKIYIHTFFYIYVR